MAKLLSKEVLLHLRQLAEGTAPLPPSPRFNPDVDALHGGISGRSMPVAEFELVEGLRARRTFAHVFAPYLMAFGRPEGRAPHPGPWRAVSGGLGFDIDIELVLDRGVRPTSLNRINTLWWALALIRLRSAAPLRMPVVSNLPFADARDSAEEPVLRPVEMERPRIAATHNPPAEIGVQHLEWVREVFERSVRLLDEPHFNRAFQTFEGAFWSHSLGAAVVTFWGALETLYRPGRRNTGKVLSRSIATLIVEPGADRERMQQRAAKLYEERGSTAHDSQIPELDVLHETIDLGRRSFMRCIETGQLPDPASLQQQWSAELTINRQRREGG